MGCLVCQELEQRVDDHWELIDQRIAWPEWMDGDGKHHRVHAILATAQEEIYGYPPIAPLRGFPSDVSGSLKRLVNDSGICQPSWILLKEILDADWDHPFEKTGFVRDCDVHLFSDPPGPFPQDFPKQPGTNLVSFKPKPMEADYDTKVSWVTRLESLPPIESSGYVDVSLSNLFKNPPAEFPKDYPAGQKKPTSRPQYSLEWPVTWTVTRRNECPGFEEFCREELTRLGDPNDIRLIIYSFC